MSRSLTLVVVFGFLMSPCAFCQSLPMDRFASSRQLEPGVVPHLWDLLSASRTDYEPIFRNSVTPRPADFRGQRFNGMILYVQNWRFGKILFTQYTGSNADLLTGRLYSQQLSFQKRFHVQDTAQGESGINYWPVRRVESMPMKMYVGTSFLEDGKNSLMIDYDVPSNKRVTERPLIDEVRQIPGTQLYIGRMYYRVGGHHIPFLWFALERS